MILDVFRSNLQLKVSSLYMNYFRIASEETLAQIHSQRKKKKYGSIRCLFWGLIWNFHQVPINSVQQFQFPSNYKWLSLALQTVTRWIVIRSSLVKKRRSFSSRHAEMLQTPSQPDVEAVSHDTRSLTPSRQTERLQFGSTSMPVRRIQTAASYASYTSCWAG